MSEEGIEIVYYDRYSNQLPAENVSSVQEAKHRGRMNGAVAFHAQDTDQGGYAYHIQLFPDGHFQKVESPGFNAFISRLGEREQRLQRIQFIRSFRDPAVADLGEDYEAGEGVEEATAERGGEGEERPGT